MKIAVIGFGAASIGFVNELKNSGAEIHVFEKSGNIQSSSLSGIRSDGKLMVSRRVGGILDLDTSIQQKVVDFYINHSGISRDRVEGGESFGDPGDPIFKKFYEKGFEPAQARFYHIGTDRLGNMLESIYSDILSCPNVRFRFCCTVKNIDIDGQVAKIHFEEHPPGSGAVEKIEAFDFVIIGIGRSGLSLISTITKKYPDLVLSNTDVDLGIRFELPDHVVAELNRKMYEFKVLLKSNTGYMVRTFCNNPSGKVVAEKYNKNDFYTVNGHAEMDFKTSNTNFAVLVTHSFTEPFNDPIGYGTYIAKLSNILAGGDKVILQTYQDFKNAKRTMETGRVKPTLPHEQYILGDLNLVLPRRTINSIIDFLERLNEVIPGITFPDNLVYGVEVKFYSNVLDNDRYAPIKFIGDCSGWSRSITYATGHGIVTARKYFEGLSSK